MKKSNCMRSLVWVLVMVMLTGMTLVGGPVWVSAANTAYYVDSVGGNDSNNGTSQSTAWKSLSKVNATTFGAGDQILFKAGGSWTGQLHPLGSGASGSPIKIDMYSTGNKPLIAGGGVSATLYLQNQQYWEISNLEITNSTSTSAKRRAVYIEAKDMGTCNHIYIQNVNIHDVTGITRSQDPAPAEIGWGGIVFMVRGSTTQTKFNDILVNNNYIGPNMRYYAILMMSSWCQRDSNNTNYYAESGIPDSECRPLYQSTNVRITNNYMYNVGVCGIAPLQTYGTLVDHNTIQGCMQDQWNNVPIWWSLSDEITIQNNECFNAAMDTESSAFDMDMSSRGALIQYNYSHDNPAEMLQFCPWNGSPVTNSVWRYNISLNDRYFMRIQGPDSAFSNHHKIKPPPYSTPLFGVGK